MKIAFTSMATLSMLSMAAIGSSQLYSDNFDTDTSANWTVNNGPSDGTATFSFDYSTYGIPSAPGSGGTTRGLRMMANQSGGIFSGLSVSPNGQSFSGDYLLRADVWMNFVGPAPAGGSGTTQLGGMGIGTNGTVAQWPGFANSIYFMTTLDGGSTADWRAYSSAAVASYADGNPVYYATTRNSSNPYYAPFGGGVPPAAQTALFPNQTGAAQAGCIAFGWHKSIIMKFGNFVTWTVDGLPIARVNLSTVTLSGGNILLNHSDTNAGSSTDPNDFLNATIFDNVRVHAVPEPMTLTALGLGALALMRRRRR